MNLSYFLYEFPRKCIYKTHSSPFHTFKISKHNFYISYSHFLPYPV